MAAQLLTRTHQTLALASPSSPARLVLCRRLATKVELIEIDLSDDAAAATTTTSFPEDSASECDSEAGVSGGGSREVVGMRRLEDAIHGVLVRRSAPDWLPFVPGSSYWVPPVKRPLALLELFGRMAAASAASSAGVGAATMTEEESMSFTTVRGWPSSAYFVEGKSPNHVKGMPRKDATFSDDEEG